MSDLRKAAQQALIVLRCIEYDSCETIVDGPDKYMCDDAYDALKAALAQPEQEPVAWLRKRDNKLTVNDGGIFSSDWTPLYTAPPQRKPLTEEEMCEVLKTFCFDPDVVFSDVVRAIEKAHGIGENK